MYNRMEEDIKTRMEEDIKTIRKRQLEIKLSDADTLRLIEKAARVGLTVSGLLENFIADLVCGIFSNGSDERMYADEWFDRCGFGMFQKKTLLRHLLENGVNIESFITAYEENEEYKAHPENFEEEMEDYGMEPGESFWFEDDLEYYLDGWKPEGKPDMNKELETIRAYLNEVNTITANKNHDFELEE